MKVKRAKLHCGVSKKYTSAISLSCSDSGLKLLPLYLVSASTEYEIDQVDGNMDTSSRTAPFSYARQGGHLQAVH